MFQIRCILTSSLPKNVLLQTFIHFVKLLKLWQSLKDEHSGLH